LTGESDPAQAVQKLTAAAETVVVTLGPDGALASIDGRVVHVDGHDVEPVVDTTGAEELFMTAFAWAELNGADAATALSWANLYAGLSVTMHTGSGGAVSRERLIDEGTQRGLPALPLAV
jgi:sugar/nucleoside kinase (ribokinase family)